MLHHLGRRALDLVIGVFALLGFFFVPLGRHTGFEHVRAVAATAPAAEAYRGLLAAGERLHRTLLDKLGIRHAHRSEPAQGKTAPDDRPGPAMLKAAPTDAGPDASLLCQ